VDLLFVQKIVDSGVNRRHSHLHLVPAPAGWEVQGRATSAGTPDPGNPEDISATWVSQVRQVPSSVHDALFKW
jgi:hypothetical protein